MLGVRSLAVFRNRRASPAPIGIGTLLGGGVCPRLRVVRLTGTCGAVAVRYCGAASVSPCGRVVAGAIVRYATWTVGAIVAAAPGGVSVIRAAAIHHCSGSVPATVPVAIPQP